MRTVRTPGQRAAGAVVAAAVLVAATQLLAHAFGTSMLIDADQMESLTSTIRRSPTDGAGILGGLVLVAMATAVVASLLNSRRRGTGTITTRRRKGQTRIDRPTLADALERELAAVDQRADVHVRVTRRGRVDLRIVTPDPSRTGTAVALSEHLDALCAGRSLPLRSGKITATVPRKVKGRRRVR